ncbi:MAG: 4-diphosphocytidyl-2-C-methyl-D-erythritol kinase [Pseudomonadota bacterium]
MVTETALARAKVNLCLHVTGQRADGYHLLDSLVVFAGTGDQITVSPADRLSLRITGPQAANLPVSDDNLVLRAARLFGDLGAQITLDKHLPIASGIGGGSADAAATLKALSRLWGLELPNAAQVLVLGADVPVCLAGHSARIQGVGEQVTELPHPLPTAWMVLVNPGVAVSTPMVFRGLENRNNAPMPAQLPKFTDLAAFAAFLAAQRNDLEPPALAIAPMIGTVKQALAAQKGCYLARMSGSGATCFALFATEYAANIAAQTITQLYPSWWVQSASLVD